VLRRRPLWIAAIAGGLLLAACGGGQVTALSQADLPSTLGLTANPAQTTSLRNGAPCPSEQALFSPPEKRALPFDGSGEPIPYTDLVSLTMTCPTTAGTELVFRSYTSTWSGYSEQALNGIGDTAELANASDTGEYPQSHTFLLAVRVGRQLAIVGVESPSNVAPVDRSLMVTLARRVVTNLSQG